MSLDDFIVRCAQDCVDAVYYPDIPVAPGPAYEAPRPETPPTPAHEAARTMPQPADPDTERRTP